jgi:hypothetical protein
MKGISHFLRLQKLIVRDHNFIFTISSFLLILIIYSNLIFASSPIIGTAATLAYFMINGIFLGHAFFEKETPLFRLMFGTLLLIMLLGFVGLLAVIIYNLDIIRFTLVLFIVTTISSLINRKVKNKNVT